MEILVNLSSQQLKLRSRDGAWIRCYSVSTATNGAGELGGSHCTPRGWHVIRAKIGAGLAAATVFKARRPTGEQWTKCLHDAQPERDWILSRILWLSGTEPGYNRLGCVDTMRRYIYIHGTPDCAALGVAASHGCIRMRNRDVIELFALVAVGTRVRIVEAEAND